MIIGLTGGSGTGKSSAAAYFEKNDFVIIDFDKISREVTEIGSDCLKELINEFGNGILNDDLSLNRRLLGQIVFADGKKLAILNEITHKFILKRAEEIVEQNMGKNIIFDAPLLFEAQLEQKCDYVISILADRQKRIERICKRDSVSRLTAINRIDSQKKDDFYIQKSDFCVYNNSNIEELECQISKILRSILNNE